MLWELKLQQAGITAEIKAAQRLERKLKKMRDRKTSSKFPARGCPEEGYAFLNTPNSIIPGTNPEGYKLWGNARLLEIQENRQFTGTMARMYHLTHMFLKGVPYKVVEQTNKSGKQLSEEDWDCISNMAEGYAEYRKMSDDRPLRKYEFASVQDLAQRFEQWKQGF